MRKSTRVIYKNGRAVKVISGSKKAVSSYKPSSLRTKSGKRMRINKNLSISNTRYSSATPNFLNRPIPKPIKIKSSIFKSKPKRIKKPTKVIVKRKIKRSVYIPKKIFKPRPKTLITKKRLIRPRIIGSVPKGVKRPLNMDQTIKFKGRSIKLKSFGKLKGTAVKVNKTSISFYLDGKLVKKHKI